MMALLRKEMRLSEDVLLGACVLLVGSFPLALIGVAMQGIRPFPWGSVVGAGCVLNQYTLVLTGALLGAVIFAREREDGNTHFLAMLPISPRRQSAAKLVAALTIWAVLWTVNVIIVLVSTLAAAGGLDPLLPFLSRMVSVLLLSFAALGLSGLAGCYLASVTGAALTGAAILLAVAVARSIGLSAMGGGDFFGPYFSGGFGVLGAAALALAGWTHGRRALAGGRPWAGVATGRGVQVRMGGSLTGALLWKDVRLIRIPLLAGLVVVALPFAAAGGKALLVGEAAQDFRTASLLAMALGWIVLPLWSGSSLTSEWSGNTQPFLGSLPVSARRILLSKLVVALIPGGLVILASVGVFGLAQGQIPSEPRLYPALTWDAFNASHFLGGAVAYTSALPVTFAVAWFVAARLRRKIVAIVLGVLSGPLSMAAWAVTGGPGGFLAAQLTPLPAVVVHGAIFAGLALVLVLLGNRQLVRQGLG